MTPRLILICLLGTTCIAGSAAGQQSAPVQRAAGDARVRKAATPDGRYAIEYRWEGAGPREAQFQVLHLSVKKVPDSCQRPGMDISVDAAMPEHGHGLNYRPVVTVLTANREFLVKGLMFHMSGSWEVHVDFACGKTTARLAIPVSIP